MCLETSKQMCKIYNISLFFSCKDVDDNNIYNEIEFYDKVFKAVSILPFGLWFEPWSL